MPAGCAQLGAQLIEASHPGLSRQAAAAGRTPAKRRRGPPIRREPSAAKARLACAFVFAANGLAYGSTVARMPALKAQAGLDEAALGQAILCLGLGGLAAFPLAALLRARVGSKRVTGAAVAMLLLVWPLIGLASGWWSLAVSFFLFGYAMGGIEIAGGLQAVIVEQRLGRPVMSGFYGHFSIGGLVGALGASALAGVAPFLHFAALSVPALLLLPLAVRPLLPDRDEAEAEGEGTLRLPPWPLLGIAALALCAGVAEDSIADWGALLLKARFDSPDHVAALAYAGFSVAMITGRLLGDRLRAALPPVLLLRGLAAVAGLGMTLTLTAPGDWLGIAGLALAGLGLSVMAPVLFSAAGRQPGVDPGTGVASISTMDYAGMLLGPAVIGHLAAGYGLARAMLLPAGLCLVLLAFAGALRRTRA